MRQRQLISENILYNRYIILYNVKLLTLQTFKNVNRKKFWKRYWWITRKKKNSLFLNIFFSIKIGNEWICHKKKLGDERIRVIKLHK